MKLPVLTLLLSSLAAPLLAGSDALRVTDAYARSGPKSGAVFLVIENASETADRLIGATSDVARKTELHTHAHGHDGVMKMRPIEGGIEIPAQGTHALERGGDHVMLMGLTAPLQTGETVSITLTFEHAGEIVVEAPVDNDR